MSVVLDIIESYRAPRRVARRRAAPPRQEARALIILMVGCFLMFLAQWPNLQRLALADPSIPLDQRIGGALLGWLFIMPLALYVVAGASRLIARLLGGQGDGYSARMALFWALLAAAPLWLLNGLVAALIGPGPALTGVGLIAVLAFFGIWIAGLWELERPQGQGT